MKRIGTFAGSGISLDFTDGVKLVIEWPFHPIRPDVLAINGLVDALGGMTYVQRNGMSDLMRAEIPYNEALDQRLMELVDLFVAIRYAHPRMVQLPLALSEDEEEELTEVMGG